MLDFIPPWGIPIAAAAVLICLLAVDTFGKKHPALTGSILATVIVGIATWALWGRFGAAAPFAIAAIPVAWLIIAAMWTTYLSPDKNRPTDRTPSA